MNKTTIKIYYQPFCFLCVLLITGTFFHCTNSYAQKPLNITENTTANTPSSSETINQEHQLAVNLARSGEREKALNLLKKLHETTPTDTSVTFDYILVLTWDSQWSKAIEIYEQLPAETNPPSYLLKEIAVAYGALGKKAQQDNNTQGLAFLEQGLKIQPDLPELLLLKGELLERQKDFVGAIKCYNRVLEILPGNEAANNLKMRALMDLGSNSLAIEQMEKNNAWADPVLKERGKGNLQVSYLKWDEPKSALILSNRHLELSDTQDKNNKIDPLAASIEINRTRWDKIVALSENQNFDQAIIEYNKAIAEKLEIPSWVSIAVADAYLYKHEPQKAYEIYLAAHQAQPKSFKTNMALYYSLVDLDRFYQATKLLNTIDSELPAQVLERGILSDNWQKAEVAYNKVWLLMYQDRLAEAEELVQKYLQTSPANTQLRTVLAHIYLWRGWPRLALKEFQIIQNMDYENIPATNGYSRSLYDNVKKQPARDEIQRAYEKYPKNRHVARTRQLIKVDDKPYITFSGYYYSEGSDSNELFLSLRGDQPITNHHQIFAETVWKNTKNLNSNQTIDRAYLGDIWRPNNSWKLTGAFSLDETSGKDTGGLGTVEFTPDDFWTFGAGYDSFSLDIPLRSQAQDVTSEEYDLWTRFRASESFNTLLGVNAKNFSDSNENYNYRWTTDTALTTKACWKTRLMTEFDYSTFSRQDVNYFSPQEIYDFYLIPMVEHTWWRRYEKTWVDRLYLGLGQQWQKGYGAENVGYIRYELDHRYSDTFNALVGVTYSLKNYDGGDVNGLTIYWRLRKYF